MTTTSADLAHSPFSLDRLRHGLAFAGLGLQKTLAGLEDLIFADRFGAVALERPVFVTALPEAGAALLLELLSTLPDFAAQGRRDAPALLYPLLWDRMSGPHQPEGDGAAGGQGGPEDAEEAVWTAFWASKYRPDRIEPWRAGERDAEIEDFLGSHLRKIVALRTAFGRGRGEPRKVKRYLSCNDANMARLALLSAVFPDATLLLPFRAPLEHAAALHRCHGRLSGTPLAADDDALRPIDFNGWLARDPGLLPLDPNFWLTYWCEAYEAALEAAEAAGPAVRLVDYDRLCSEPMEHLAALAETLGLVDPAPLLAQAGRLHAPAVTLRPPRGLDPGLVARARDLHDALRNRAP